MASLSVDLDHPASCTCTACWHRFCWRDAAEEWYWASSIDDGFTPMDVDLVSPPASGGAAWLPPSNSLSDELWLSLFMFTSNECPFHSFTAILEISAISRTAARALASRRAEHLRLLTINLEVEQEIDTDYAMAQQAADDFFET